jgi:3-dehydroquinate synthase
MVDAAIGGKTGVNLELPGGGLGKNLAGAFWQPRLTVADPDALGTLPRRELRAGLAECIKHAVLAGEPFFGELESIIEQAAAGDARTLDRVVPAAAAVKAGIVSRDPREKGDRALLNLGHTFGHAIETLPGGALLHGEAVAIGMVAACRCAVARGLLQASAADRVERLIARAGLPTRLPSNGGPADVGAEILRRMGFDKKAERHALRLILPCGIGDVRVVPVALTAGAACAPGEDGVQAGIAAITGAR